MSLALNNWAQKYMYIFFLFLHDTSGYSTELPNSQAVFKSTVNVLKFWTPNFQKKMPCANSADLDKNTSDQGLQFAIPLSILRDKFIKSKI